MRRARIAHQEEEQQKQQKNSNNSNNNNNYNNKKKNSNSTGVRRPETEAEAIDVFGGVRWAVYERLDVSIRYTAPVEWSVNSRVSENFVAIQCVPPPEEFLEEQLFFGGESKHDPLRRRNSETPRGEGDEGATEEQCNDDDEHYRSNNSSNKNNNNNSNNRNRDNATRKPSIHGLSISNFVYLSKVPPQVSASDLLKQFLTQFHRSVGRTSVVVGSSTFSEDQIANNISKESCDMCRELVELSGFEIGSSNNNSSNNDSSNDNNDSNSNNRRVKSSVNACAICELLFRAPSASTSAGGHGHDQHLRSHKSETTSSSSSSSSARALCKVFFHRSRRRHTVVVFAVPEDEWQHVQHLVKHAVVCVGELTHHNTGKIDY